MNQKLARCNLSEALFKVTSFHITGSQNWSRSFSFHVPNLQVGKNRVGFSFVSSLWLSASAVKGLRFKPLLVDIQVSELSWALELLRPWKWGQETNNPVRITNPPRQLRAHMGGFVFDAEL